CHISIITHITVYNKRKNENNRFFSLVLLLFSLLFFFLSDKLRNIDLREKVSRKKRKSKVKKNKKILGVSIDERPKHIDEREEFGHFEIDTVHGRKEESTCLLTLTERKTRKGIVVLIDFRDSESVTYALKKMIKEYPVGMIKSITADNGAEFSTLEEYFSEAMDIYFAHPYSAFERGGNENFNKLIRRFIPKGSSIDDYNRKYIEKIIDIINNTPRKILNYRTANELFEEEIRNLLKQTA
ncbi:IS30 family transposase, partial [Gemella bergeri]